ncbi:hypothetical protein PHAVU_011G147700, partial [Phaseolus vulgaris]
VVDEDACKENDDCKVKLSLCKDSAICVDEVCKCRAPILGKLDKCTSASDCPFCITSCDKYCDTDTGLCKCFCH